MQSELLSHFALWLLLADVADSSPKAGAKRKPATRAMYDIMTGYALLTYVASPHSLRLDVAGSSPKQGQKEKPATRAGFRFEFTKQFRTFKLSKQKAKYRKNYGRAQS